MPGGDLLIASRGPAVRRFQRRVVFAGSSQASFGWPAPTEVEIMPEEEQGFLRPSAAYSTILARTTASTMSPFGACIAARNRRLLEAFAPLRHHLPWRVQAGRDLVVAQAVGGVQHDPGPHDIRIR